MWSPFPRLGNCIQLWKILKLQSFCGTSVPLPSLALPLLKSWKICNSSPIWRNFCLLLGQWQTLVFTSPVQNYPYVHRKIWIDNDENNMTSPASEYSIEVYGYSDSQFQNWLIIWGTLGHRKNVCCPYLTPWPAYYFLKTWNLSLVNQKTHVFDGELFQRCGQNIWPSGWEISISQPGAIFPSFCPWSILLCIILFENQGYFASQWG